MKHLITREKLQEMIDDPKRQELIVGRALVVLLNNQTDGEQRSATTNEQNGEGFTGADAYGGTLTAKYYLKHKKLLDWQLEKWTRKQKNGYSRLTKYWKQLDQAAKVKAGVA